LKRILCAVAGIAALATVSRTAKPQSTVGQVAVSAGSATDERGVRSDAMTLAPAIVFTPGVNSNFTLGANATRFANTAWQIGVGAAANARTPSTAGFALVFNGSGNAAQASFNATFAQADATPSLQFSAGPLTLIGGAHAATGYTAVSAQSSQAPLLPSTTQLVSQTRTSFAPSYGGELHVGANSPVSALLSFREEPAHVGGMVVTDRLAGATLAFGRATLSAVAGHRDAPDEQVDFASGSASIPLTSVLSLTLAGGKYPSNRLTGAAGGRFFSTGFALRLGGAGAAATLPRPEGVPRALPEFTRLAIRAPDAARVEVAGDWNSWTRVSATRATNGVWYVDLPLTPGEYRYAFFVDGAQWRVPRGVVAVDDGFGGKAAYVTVQTADIDLVKHHEENK
jgi:hypothetical protein